jgi:hypothetical protein
MSGYQITPGVYEFRPDNNITRAEISKIMVLSLAVIPPTSTPT